MPHSLHSPHFLRHLNCELVITCDKVTVLECCRSISSSCCVLSGEYFSKTTALIADSIPGFAANIAEICIFFFHFHVSFDLKLE